MQKIKIVTDSGSDISAADEKELDIKVMNFKISLGGKSYVSRQNLDNQKFYKLMGECDDIPATSQITAFEYEELFESCLAEGLTDVINIIINSKGSATFSNAEMAKKTFFEANPGCNMNIYNIDSRNYTIGYGIAVVKAAQMAREGKTAAEIVKYLEDWFEKLVLHIGVYTLKYAKKSGRIPSAAAFVGELMGLRPILKSYDGAITIIDKVRGDKNVIPRLVKTISENIEQGSEYSVVYGSNPETKDEFVAELTKAIGYPPFRVETVGAAVAANIGSLVVAAAYKSK